MSQIESVSRFDNCHAFVCDDRLDNDGDGLPDYPRDPDCLDPTQAIELPEPGELLMLAAGVAALVRLSSRSMRAAPPGPAG